MRCTNSHRCQVPVYPGVPTRLPLLPRSHVLSTPLSSLVRNCAAPVDPRPTAPHQTPRLHTRPSPTPKCEGPQESPLGPHCLAQNRRGPPKPLLNSEISTPLTPDVVTTLERCPGSSNSRRSGPDKKTWDQARPRTPVEGSCSPLVARTPGHWRLKNLCLGFWSRP